MTAYQFCHIDGQQFAYRKSGQGQPIILLHGITSSSFPWESLASCLDNRDLTDIAGKLPGLAVPTLILRVLADPYLSAEIADRLHRDIPGSRLETLAGASHFLMLDAPRWVADQIHLFAQENNATAECG